MLTKSLDLPLKEELPKQTWASKKLYPISEAVASIARQSNIYEIFAGFALVVTAIGELFGKHLSYSWYVVVILLLAEALYFRTFKKELDVDIQKK